MNLIHLYPNPSFHEPAYIVGNEEGLKALRAIIDVALVKRNGCSGVFTSDGEGYDLHVIVTDNPNIALPYTNLYAQECRSNAVWPWDVK